MVGLLLGEVDVAGRFARRDQLGAGGARSSSAGDASRSYTTTSARRSSSAPRTVRSPGSPGPAPTRYTVTPRRLQQRAVVQQRIRPPRVEEVGGRGAARRRRVGVARALARSTTWPSTAAEQRLDVDRRRRRATSQRAARQIAAATELGEVGALGVDRDGETPASSIAVTPRERVGVVDAALHRQRALPHLGQHDRRIEQLVGPIVEPEPHERGRRDHDRVVVGGRARAGWRCCRAARRT